jgi:hypothetical protein
MSMTVIPITFTTIGALTLVELPTVVARAVVTALTTAAMGLAMVMGHGRRTAEPTAILRPHARTTTTTIGTDFMTWQTLTAHRRQQSSTVMTGLTMTMMVIWMVVTATASPGILDNAASVRKLAGVLGDMTTTAMVKVTTTPMKSGRTRNAILTRIAAMASVTIERSVQTTAHLSSAVVTGPTTMGTG